MGKRPGKPLRIRYRPKRGDGFTLQLPPGTTKAQAKAKKEELLRQFKLGSIETRGGSLSEFFEVYLKRRADRQYSTVAKQIKDFEHHIEPYFGSWKLQDIRPSDLLRWQDIKAKEVSPGTYKNLRSHFTAIMKEAVADERTTSNPWAGIKSVKSKAASFAFWDQHQTNKFLAYAKEHNFRVFQVIAFAIYTGLRPGEMRGLLRKDIDWDAGTMWVNRTWDTKTNRLKNQTKTGMPRLVPIPRMVLDAIGNLRALGPDEQLFPFLINSWGHRHFRPLAIKAGLPPIRFHECRHSFASQCIMAGMSMVEVKELLGHRKISTTIDTYTHIAERQKVQSTDRLLAGADWGASGSVIPLKKDHNAFR